MDKHRQGAGPALPLRQRRAMLTELPRELPIGSGRMQTHRPRWRVLYTIARLFRQPRPIRMDKK